MSDEKGHYFTIKLPECHKADAEGSQQEIYFTLKLPEVAIRLSGRVKALLEAVLSRFEGLELRAVTMRPLLDSEKGQLTGRVGQLTIAFRVPEQHPAVRTEGFEVLKELRAQLANDISECCTKGNLHINTSWILMGQVDCPMSFPYDASPIFIDARGPAPRADAEARRTMTRVMTEIINEHADENYDQID